MPSEITLFLLGSGVALFIALLGWSEQIKNPQKEMTELESEFRRKFKLRSRDLSPIIKNTYQSVEQGIQTSLFEEIKAITKLHGSEELTDPDDIAVVTKFREANDVVELLEKLYSCKYRFTIYLASMLLIFGFISVFLGNSVLLDFSQYINFALTAEMILFVIPFLMVGYIVYKIWEINKMEDEFRKRVKNIENSL